MKVKRNDLCHCGSDKKYKDCHGNKKVIGQWQKYSIFFILFIILGWFINDLFFQDRITMSTAPPGKVWSEEHGHYHDINTNQTTTPSVNSNMQNYLNVPQPEGPIPEGKIWSKEHGHWHDIVNN
jgi:hypothetical protein